MSEPTLIDLTPLRSADSLPIKDTSIDLLDLDKVSRHISQATANERYHGPTDPQEYLLRRKCLVDNDGEQQATTAGILCFGRAPQTVFPRAVVDLGHYRGVEPISYDVLHMEKDIGGTILEQIEHVESYLWSNTHRGMTVNDESARRVDVHEYPRVVLRELTVNMLVHRDYHNFLSAARVQRFRNRTEWISPGGLPPGVTVDNILQAQASRNPTILGILYEAGFVEAFGQGLDTVVAVLRRDGLAPPRFDDAGTFFIVTVAGRPAEALYTGPYAQLNDRQRRILALIRIHGAATARDIAVLFDQQVTARSIQRDLKELQASSMITVEGKGRSVRYQLSEAIR